MSPRSKAGEPGARAKPRAISGETLEEADHDERESRARLAARASELEELVTGTRPERIRAQEALASQLEAALERLDVDLRDSTLTAPFDGIVAAREVDEGTVVEVGEPVVRLVESGVLEAWIGVPREELATLEAGAELEVAVGGARVPARVIDDRLGR